MIQTVTQNSGLSPNLVGCTGRKSNRPWLRARYAQVACALRPDRARTAPRPCSGHHVVAQSGRVVGHALPCRARWRVVSQRLGLLCRSPPSQHIELCHDTTPTALELPCVSQRSCVVSQGAAVLYRNTWLHCIAKQKVAPATIQNLYRDSPPAARLCAQGCYRSPRVQANCVACTG